jgi:hypothetical protein
MCPMGWFRRRFPVVTRLRRTRPSNGPCISGMFPSAGSQRPDRCVWPAPPARITTHQRRKLAIYCNRQNLDHRGAGQVARSSGGRGVVCACRRPAEPLPLRAGTPSADPARGNRCRSGRAPPAPTRPLGRPGRGGPARRGRAGTPAPGPSLRRAAAGRAPRPLAPGSGARWPGGTPVPTPARPAVNVRQGVL